MSDIRRNNRFFVSKDEATEAFRLVRAELQDRGVLWKGSKIETVKLKYHRKAIGCRPNISDVKDVMKTALSDLGKLIRKEGGAELATEGFWHHGAIHIPQFGVWFCRQGSIEDVIRHEFGHALADLYPRTLSRGGVFRKAFGKTYGGVPAEEYKVAGWEDRYVSKYATSATQEDFAETFMLFVKHKGRIPTKFAKKPAIAKKWKAVAEIVKRVAAAMR